MQTHKKLRDVRLRLHYVQKIYKYFSISQLIPEWLVVVLTRTQCYGSARSLTRNSNKVPSKAGIKSKWPHTAHTVQLTKRHNGPAHQKRSVSQSAVTVGVRTVHPSCKKWHTRRVKRNKHNAAAGIISGSVDTGQPAFVCLFVCFRLFWRIIRKGEGPYCTGLMRHI